MVWGFVAAAASIYGAIKGSEAASQAGKARAAALRRQAEFLKKQALFAEEIGNVRKMQFQRQATQFRSSQRGMFAKAGVDISGSVLNVLGETSGRMEQQMHMIERATKNEILFANVKRTESLLTAASVEASIPHQQQLAWAQGIGGAASGLARSNMNWGTLGSNALTGIGAAGSSVGRGFQRFGKGSLDYISSWSNLSLGGG